MFKNIKFTFSLLVIIITSLGMISLFEEFFNLYLFGFNLQVFVFPLFVLSLIITCFFVWVNIISPLEKLKSHANDVASGEVRINKSYRVGNIIDEIGLEINNIATNLIEATNFSLAIGEGKFDQNLKKVNVNEGLGLALQEMRIKLQNVAEEEAKRNWSVNGVAIFGELLRKEQDKGIEELSFLYIKELINYLKANQGGIYLIQDSDPEDVYIKLVSSFAYNRRKFHDQRLEMNEGLVAQCIIEADYIYMDDVPDNYIRISSGLGDANPRSILLVPLITNENILGVIEIASFNTLKEFEIDFVKHVAESFASTIQTMYINANTKKLLEESNNITLELKRKEEVLQLSSQELKDAQKTLETQMQAIEREAAYTKSIVTAINSTNASLLLDMKGNILDVNEMFLSIMDYKKEELIGENEISFVAEDEITSERYQMLMQSVREGAYNSGEFRRISRNGKELWITGSYSPIFDVNGIPNKIILFAQFTTEQKERELELKSRIDAINTSIATIELDLNLGVISGNPAFMKDFGFKRMDMKGLTFEKLIGTNTINSDEFLALWEITKEDNVITQPINLFTKDGFEKNYVATFSPTKNLQGKVYKILVILVDFTEQTLLKNQLSSLLEDEKRKSALLSLKLESDRSELAEEIAELVLELQDGLDITPLKLEIVLGKKSLPTMYLDSELKIKNLSSLGQDILGLKRVDFYDVPFKNFLAMSESEINSELFKFESKKFSQSKFVFKTKSTTNVTLNTFILPTVTEGEDTFALILVNEDYFETKR